MGLFRSEEILHKRLRMSGNINNAVRIMDQIGMIERDILEFIDLTKDEIELKKEFYPSIKRCEDLEAKLISFEDFARKYGVHIEPYENFQIFINDIERDQTMKNKKYEEYFDAIENEINEEERKLLELVESFNKVQDDLMKEIQRKLTMQKYFLLTTNNINFTEEGGNSSMRLSTIIGICDFELDLKIKRMLFRAGYGKIVSSFFDLDLKNYEKYVPNSNFSQKKVFILFFPHSDYLLNKVNKILDLFNCLRFDPINNNNIDDINNFGTESTNKIEEQKNYLTQANKAIQNFLIEKYVNNNKYSYYKLYIQKEKLIYQNLSKCITRENFIDGEVWVLKKNFEYIQAVLKNQDDSMTATFSNIIDDNYPKPTYIKTNEFTRPFQNIVNLYGVPNYGEINPGYFTIISFPFLFGIMFGDIGHGLLLLIFSLYLIIKNDYIRKNKETSKLISFAPYRYFVLLLGIYSVYCGFIYNEFLAIPINLFGSCYKLDKNISSNEYTRKDKCVYLFGIDPKWYISKNELQFTNSFKMKFSVIVGVIQMSFGIMLQGLNNIHFGEKINFFFDFLPKIIFMTSIFAYLVLMIIIKWLTDWSNDTSKSPGLIKVMMDFLLAKHSQEPPVWTNSEYIAQEKLNRILLSICIFLIPTMLFVKPILNYLLYHKEFTYKKDERLMQDDNNNININAQNNEIINTSSIKNLDPNVQFSYLYDKRKMESKKRKMDFVSLFIDQLINTIEFVLNSLSNTASYLRLWALSLAHSQLSEIFVEYLFLYFAQDGQFNGGLNFIYIFISFFIYGNVTILVLIFMDSLECGLHTLRLHWVEFQNKFFKAEGYLFKPFSFKRLVTKSYDI